MVTQGTATLPSLSHYPPTSPTWLGNSPDFEALDRYYDGLIDEVRVYSRALSASDVVALFDADKNGF
ncbi:MAG: hypothetical protein HRU17_00305 [Polyangiaceae bacterium]|nr:hypothetical protein [Polyangiaceae bacterium]